MKKLLTAIALTIATSVFSAEYVVIVNPANSTTSLSKAELKRLYTGKMGQLGGQKAVPINLGDGDALLKEFLSEVIKMDPNAYKQFWVEAQIKGEGTSPMVQKSTLAVKAIVSELPGAIGYVKKENVDASVKIVEVK